MTITTITLWQPWASLVAIGAKEIETRSWSTKYRGPLAIHAAKRRPVYQGGEIEKLMLHELNAAGIGWMEQPLGVVVATCELADVYPVEELWSDLQDNERAFGNFSAGRFAWELRQIRQLDPPIPARGSQGLWQWDGFDKRT